MKKYRVIVNGVQYEVELEAMDSASAASNPSPVATPVAAPASSAPATTPEGGEKVTSPMPGNILAVNVSNGQSVKSGDILFILEAMKMENEILAPCDGVVSAVSVTKGQSVETGVLLCTIA